MSRRLCGDAFLLAAGVSVVLSALVAVSSDLHLFGDGSWYLLNLAATRRYAYWIGDWPTQFFQSRIGDYLVTQTPVLVAIHLGVHSLRALSKIYGISLWLAVLLPVWICLRLSRSPLDRLFPVIGLIAGTMNGAAFLVAESHLVAAFYWAILFLLLFGDERSTGRTRLLVALSAPLLLCYESMLFFGVILALVCLDRRRTAATGGPLYLGLAAWHLVAAALAAAAILWPFDPTNRQGFLAAMIGLLTRSDHLGAQVSIVCLVATVVLLMAGSWLQTLAFSAALAAILMVVAKLLAGAAPAGLDVETQARTMNFTVPLALSAVFFALRASWLRPDARGVFLACVVAGCLGIAQSFWLIAGSQRWTGMLGALRTELAEHTGPIPYDQSVLSRPELANWRPARLHGVWPLLPLAIYEADHGRVRSLVVPAGGWLPFDPYAARSLPILGAYGVDYDVYIRSLANRAYRLGFPIDFTASGSGSRYMVSGWSYPEPSGTWTEGEEVDLRVPVTVDPQHPDVVLEAEIAPSLGPGQPSLAVDVSVNGTHVGRWQFREGFGDSPRWERTRIAGDVFWKSAPVAIRFAIAERLQSPLELGKGPDPRKLGLSFRKLRIVGASRR